MESKEEIDLLCWSLGVIQGNWIKGDVPWSQFNDTTYAIGGLGIGGLGLVTPEMMSMVLPALVKDHLNGLVVAHDSALVNVETYSGRGRGGRSHHVWRVWQDVTPWNDAFVKYCTDKLTREWAAAAVCLGWWGCKGESWHSLKEGLSSKFSATPRRAPEFDS